MSLPNPIGPKPKTVASGGATYGLMAFYYPDYGTAWDVVYPGQALTNFLSRSIELYVQRHHRKFQLWRSCTLGAQMVVHTASAAV